MAVLQGRQTDPAMVEGEKEEEGRGSKSLEDSFQEIALADSGKLMLPMDMIEEPGSDDGGDDDGDGIGPTADTPPDISSPMDESVYSAGPSDISRHSGPRSMAPLSEYIGKKDLLLRLLQSDYFDAWIGLAYLWRYNGKDVGLQYFICERMRERPLGEIEFVLPQIW